jgi:hypothetical protein
VNSCAAGRTRLPDAGAGRNGCGLTRTSTAGPDFSLVVTASNWFVGMILGAMFLLAALFGRKALFPMQILRMFLTMALGIATCVLARETILQIFVALSGEDGEDCTTTGDETADDVESSSSKKGEEQKRRVWY